MATLTDLGFNVVDTDAKADADDHLEDLRVTDPRAQVLVALVEVKRYAKGANTEAL